MDCPSESFLSRSADSASVSDRPVTLGTLILPSPTATSTVTSVSFSAFSPALGVWLRMLPAGASASTFSFGAAPSLRPASVRVSSAAKVDSLPTTSGTTVFLGSIR